MIDKLEGSYFTLDSIRDKELLERMIQEKIRSILSSPVATNGRSDAEVELATRRGIPPELWLIENAGYLPANGQLGMEEDKYHDSFKDDFFTEVKTIVTEFGEFDNEQVMKSRIENKMVMDREKYDVTQKWNNSKYYLLFHLDENTGIYRFCADMILPKFRKD